MRKQRFLAYKNQAIILRREGKTYAQIREILPKDIPASTLSTWFKQINFSPEEKFRITSNTQERIREGMRKAAILKQGKRRRQDEELARGNAHLKVFLAEKDIAKIGLAMLYLCEGSKRRSGGLCFGNSDPRIIHLFLRTLGACYSLNPSKFRATVQCRADQNTETLMAFWSEITKIPLTQFYSPRIDKRTVGQPTMNPDYKGVCRIEYFSTAIYNEVTIIGGLL